MKKFIFFFSLMVLTQCISAKKIPGYMGLKFSLQYQGGLDPQWGNLAYSYRPYLFHNIQAGYVVSRKHEIGLQYTRLDYSSGFWASPYDYNSGNSVVINYRTLTANNLTFYVKFFRARKGFIAPLGRYCLLGINYQMTTDKFRANSTNGTPITENIIVKSHDVGFTFGVGRNIIVANRMLISVEGDINIPFSSGIRAALSSTQLGSGEVGTLRASPSAYRHVNALDVMLVNLFQIKIGIGALLF